MSRAIASWVSSHRCLAAWTCARALALTTTLALASAAQAEPIKLDPNLFGRLDQGKLEGSVLPFCACGPVAAANSFLYLQNAFPKKYDRKLIPDSNQDGKIDDLDLVAVATLLADEDHMDVRLSISGVYWENFIFGKMKYMEDQAPRATKYRAQMKSTWGDTNQDGTVDQNDALPSDRVTKPKFVQDNAPPTVDFITGELKDHEDVEIGVVNANGGHILTVTGIDYDAATNLGKLWFIDPFGGVTGDAMIRAVDGYIVTSYKYKGDPATIWYAASESVPEPSPTTLWITASIGVIWYRSLHRRRKRCAEAPHLNVQRSRV